ncbi:UNVERIFIED_CONTAM: hypothetical protein GTU68_013453 [Idotea baltica]|nr:hypothetical protein [Idotea baltica]
MCLIGPTAGGKTSVSKTLLSENVETLKLSVSVTTRTPRTGEIDQKDYYFISEEDFKTKIHNKEFIEWEVNHGMYYGTLKEALENTSTDLLFDIDIKGAIKLKALFPERTTVVFFVPPTFEELKLRLNKRGNISQEEMDRRFETMKLEYSTLLSNKGLIDYFVVNDCFDEACTHAHSILEAERSRLSRISLEYINSILKISI